VIAGVSMVLMTTVSFYTITAYTPTFGKGHPAASAKRCTARDTLCGVSNLILVAAHGVSFRPC